MSDRLLGLPAARSRPVRDFLVYLLTSGAFPKISKRLRKKIHIHGKMYKPEELLQRAIGEKLEVSPFVEYIKTKYSELYGFQNI